MKPKPMVKRIVWVCLVFMAVCAPWYAGWAEATGTPPMIEVTQRAGITADIENNRLGEVLRLMADRKLFEIRGGLPSREEISIHFTDLSLEEALGKLLRGYNYALVGLDATRPPVLMFMGRVTRGAGFKEPMAPVPQLPSANLSGLSSTQTAVASPAEEIPERPVKTRRALPTKLAAYMASLRSATLQNRPTPSRGTVQQAEQAEAIGLPPGAGSDAVVPVETPKVDQPSEAPKQPESAKTGDQGSDQ